MNAESEKQIMGVDRLVRKCVANRSIEPAMDEEDLYQETMLNLIRNQARYDSSKGAFSTWTHHVCRTSCNNKLRAFGRKSGRAKKTSVDLNALSKDVPNRRLENKEEVDKMLAVVTDRDREIIRRRVVFGDTCRAIGDDMGLHRKHVSILYNCAMKKIREVAA